MASAHSIELQIILSSRSKFFDEQTQLFTLAQ